MPQPQVEEEPLPFASVPSSESFLGTLAQSESDVEGSPTPLGILWKEDNVPEIVSAIHQDEPSPISEVLQETPEAHLPEELSKDDDEPEFVTPMTLGIDATTCTLNASGGLEGKTKNELFNSTDPVGAITTNSSVCSTNELARGIMESATSSPLDSGIQQETCDKDQISTIQAAPDKILKPSSQGSDAITQPMDAPCANPRTRNAYKDQGKTLTSPLTGMPEETANPSKASNCAASETLPASASLTLRMGMAAFSTYSNGLNSGEAVGSVLGSSHGTKLMEVISRFRAKDGKHERSCGTASRRSRRPFDAPMMATVDIPTPEPSRCKIQPTAQAGGGECDVEMQTLPADGVSPSYGTVGIRDKRSSLVKSVKAFVRMVTTAFLCPWRLACRMLENAWA